MTISFDSFPLIYQLLLFLAAFGLGGFIFIKRDLSNSFPEKTFFLLSTVFLVFARLPVLVFNRELNADESQMLAQALTLAKDPVYWRSVDGTTGGPLSSYFLIPVALLRGQFDYIAAHIGALSLVVITVFFLYKALINWFGAVRATLGIFPAILFYGFTRYPDFVHYTSEHFPVALLAASVWLTSLLDRKRELSTSQSLLLGFLLALVPFGKIQAVPLAAAIVAYLFYLIWKTGNWRTLWLICFGGLSTYLLLFVALFLAGVSDDFFTYYIQGNFQYKNDTPLLQNILFQVSQSLNATDILLLFLPLLVTFIDFCLTPSDRKASTFKVGWLGAGIFILGMYAMSRTGSGYTHYLLFLVIPVCLISTQFISWKTDSIASRQLTYLSIVLVSSVIVFYLQVKQNGAFNRFESGPDLNRTLPFTATGTEASKFLTENDWLVVWGWNCQYYVECGTPQGVAENHSIRSIYEHPMRETYQRRFLEDMKRNEPAVFIDATGENSLWLQDTLTQSYRSFPELESYIDHNYTLQSRPDGNRLFVRKHLR